MSVSTFNHIAQEIIRQQRLMETLTAENRELRRQIADLRAGRGIHIEMGAIAFMLKDDESMPTASQADPKQMRAVPSPSQPATISHTTPNALTDITDKTVSITPEPAKISVVQGATGQAEQKSASFLEEIMIDEFAAAMTRPTALWTGPPQQSEEIDEKQKAILRRELMGSFLLE